MPDAVAEANSAPSINPTIIHGSELARVLISLKRLRFVLELFRFVDSISVILANRHVTRIDSLMQVNLIFTDNWLYRLIRWQNGTWSTRPGQYHYLDSYASSKTIEICVASDRACGVCVCLFKFN